MMSGMTVFFIWIISVGISYWGFRQLMLQEIREDKIVTFPQFLAFIVMFVPGFNIFFPFMFWVIQLDWGKFLNKLFMLPNDYDG